MQDYQPLNLAVPDQTERLIARYQGEWGQMGVRQAEAFRGGPRGYYLWAWENPHPDRTIESVTIEPDGRKFLVAAVTLAPLSMLIVNTHKESTPMASRHLDWLRQGQRDLEHARRVLDIGDYEWACFAAQQGAEKTVKALFQKAGGDAWGHSVTGLLRALPPEWHPPEEVLTAAKELDRHYIPSRYPNAHPEGAPYEYYTREETERAIDNADRIIRFCTRLLAESTDDTGTTPEEGRGIN